MAFMFRNKTIVSLLVASVFLAGCDRQALEGLNLKINAEIKSGYEKGKETASPQTQQDSQTVSPGNHNTNREVTGQTPQQQPDNTVTSQLKGNNKASDKTENTPPSSPSPSQEATTESTEVQVKVKESDPDAPMPFKEIPECSPAGITAKTNEIFYARNPQIKSIDPKNPEQMKQWKEIYAQEAKKCQ